MPAADIARQLRISRERVRQILLGLGLPTNVPSRRRYAAAEIRFPFATTVSTGAVSELLVCADLLSKGWDVFRSISQCAKCDIIAQSRQTRNIIRVEVKSCSVSGRGTVNHPKPKNDNYDHLAAVTKDGRIFYKPEIPLLNEM